MTVQQSPAELYVERIEAQIDEVLRVLAASSDEQWTRRHGADEWTAAEICGHIAEMMRFWADQARLLATSPGLSFGRGEDDAGRLSGVASGGTWDRHTAVVHLRTAANDAVAGIRALPAGAWAVEGVNASRGPMTVDAIISRLLVGHLESHAEQLRGTLGEVS